MVQESSTAVYAFMENLFAKNFPGHFTVATNSDYMVAKIVEVGLLLVGDPSESCSQTSLPCCDLKPFLKRVISFGEQLISLRKLKRLTMK